MSRALVTGAAGFVGANLCRALLRHGHEVHAVVRPDGDLWRLEDLTDDVHVHSVTLTDPEARTRTIVACRPDWVFHLAAHGAYSWQTELEPIFAVNAVAGAHLVDLALAHGVESFLQAGSSSEYGFKDHAPDEQEWIEPNSVYAVSKAAATHYARAASLREDRHIVTLRLYSAYGPWEEPNRLFPALAVHGLRGELPPLVDPATARDYIHVDDVCDAFIGAAQRTELPRGSVLNLASGRQTTLAELVEIARARFGISQEPSWGTMDGRTWDTDVWVGDPRRAESALGWTAGIGLSDGFADLVSWLRDNTERLAHYEQSLRSIAA